MGKIEHTKSFGPIGGPEFFNGGKIVVNFDALSSSRKASYPQDVKTELLYKVRTTNSPLRRVLNVLYQRYAVHSAVELSPQNVRNKRTDELEVANNECNQKLGAIASFSDGYALNDFQATIELVRQLEDSYKAQPGEQMPLSATADALSQILALTVHYEPTVSSSQGATLADLAALWSSKKPKVR